MPVEQLNKIDEEFEREFKVRRMNYDQVVVNYPSVTGIKVFKKDKDTNDYLKNVKFNAKIFDDKDNEIKLKDANTLQDMDLTDLITNQNGEMLEKGIYIYKLKITNNQGVSTEKTQKLVIIK